MDETDEGLFVQPPQLRRKCRENTDVPDDSAITHIVRMRAKLGWKTELERNIQGHRCTVADKYRELMQDTKPLAVDRGDFVYCLPRDSSNLAARHNIYDLRVVSAAAALRSHVYWTVSASQVCKICVVSGAEIMDIVPLAEWLHERANYYAIKDLKVFSQFRFWKAFTVWKRNIHRAKTDHSRTVILKQLYLADEMFQGCLLYLQSACEDAVTLRHGDVRGDAAVVLVKIHDSHTYSLEEFCDVQSRQCDDALGKIQALREKIIAAIAQTCMKVAEVEGLAHLFSVESRVTPNYAELPSFRILQERCGRFLKLADAIFQQMLRCVVINSVRMILEFLETSNDVTSKDVKKKSRSSQEVKKSIQPLKEDTLNNRKGEQQQIQTESDIVKLLSDIKTKIEGKQEPAPVFEVHLVLCSQPNEFLGEEVSVSPSIAESKKPWSHEGPGQFVPRMTDGSENYQLEESKNATFLPQDTDQSPISDSGDSDEDHDDEITSQRSSAACNNRVCVFPTKSEFEKHMEGILNGFEQTIGQIDAFSQAACLSKFTVQTTCDMSISEVNTEHLAGTGPRAWPDCELLLGSDLDYQGMAKRILSIINGSVGEVETYSRDFNKYCVMVGTAQNVKAKISAADSELSPDDFRHILSTFKGFISECNKMNTESRVRSFRVHSMQYQTDCLQHLQSVLSSVCTSLPVLAHERNLRLLDVIHDALRKLNTDLTSVEDFVEHLTFLGQISSQVPSLEKMYSAVTQLYSVAKDYNLTISSEELALYQSLIPGFQHLKASVLYCEAKKDEGIVKFSADLDKYISNLHFELMDLKVKVRSPALVHSDTFPMEAQELILNLQEEFDAISSRARCYTTYQERFGSSITQMKTRLVDALLTQKSAGGEISTQLVSAELTEIECDLSLRKLLWESTEEWTKLSAEWKASYFQQLNVDVIQRDVNRFSHTLFMLEKGLPANAIVTCWRQSLLDFKQSLPIVVALRNPCLQNRHWETIHNTIGRLLTRDKNFTLGNLLELKISQHKDKIIDISTTATNEATLEGMLNKIIGLWNKTDFVLTVHRSELSEVPIIASAEDIMAQLEECQVIISTLKGSRYAGPIKNTVSEWDRKLNLFSRTMEEWMVCQKNWLYLEQIFLASDIQRQLPAEAKLFSQVDSSWKEIMNQTRDRPNALRAATVPGVLEMLQNNNACLEKILKCLEDFLEIKRRVFPRFYFLSNDDLLSILAESKNPNVVQRHLEKCFENIRHLHIEHPIKSPPVVVMIASAEGEKILMPKNVRIRGPVEQWLGNVESNMFDIMRKLVKVGVADWNPSVFKSWILSHPGQVVLVVSQIMFNKDCVRSFGSSNPEESLRGIHSNLVNHLEELAEIALEIPLHHQKTTLEALLTLYVHCRDTLEELIGKKVFSHEDFEWTRQLRYEWNEHNSSCYVQQGNASFSYGYEYLGCSSRLVITPLTDRCWLTLTAALHLHLGGSPAGPAGTGKTETVKDLAKALGKHCVVFNCSEGLDYKMMGKFFSGMAQSGAWCCFDEFNRIDVEVLSVIASQIHAIKAAKDSQAIRFLFEGREIRLNVSCGVFITMNPGYEGRVELPDNLKSFFRPVAMMVPDYQLIAEIMLFSAGFKAAKSLSGKLVNLYQLASKQLSQQNHYDFGMRAIKTVLVVAGQKKQVMESRQKQGKTLDVDEETLIIINALKEANLPKFLAEDVPLFENIMADLFPGITAEKTDTKRLEKAISIATHELGLQPWESQLEKVVQFYNQIVARHGVMLVGPTGGGKTTVRRILEKALAHMPLKFNGNNSSQNASVKVKVETFIINPKCVTLGELYGEIHPNTMEWSDGLLASAVRTFAAKDSHKPVNTDLLENSTEIPKPSNTRTNEQNVVSVTEHFESETMPDWHWIILDGPVDTVWVENLNTVLDDTRTLCLANSERIRLPQGMRMIFEVDSLSQASPATVSRCAMVYMDPVDLGWQPFVKTWLIQISAKVPSRGVQYVENLLMRSVEEGLQFIRKHRTLLPFPVQDLGVVMNLCKILHSFLDFMSRNGGFGQSNDEITVENTLSPFPGVSRQPSSANTVFTSVSGRVKRREEQRWFLENHPEKLTSLLGKLYVFAFTWAFGGVLKREDEQEGDLLIGLKARDESLVNVTYDFSNFVHDLFEGEQNSGVQMPLGENSIFSYFVDLQTGNFVPWGNLIPSTDTLIQKETLSFSEYGTSSMMKQDSHQGTSLQQFISTVDSIKYSFLASLLLVNNQPVLITGDSGVGKSTLIQNMLRKLQEPGGLSVNRGTILGDIFLYNESRKISLLQNITSLTAIAGSENNFPEDLDGSLAGPTPDVFSSAAERKSHRTNQLIVSMVQLGAHTNAARIQGQIVNKLVKRGRDVLKAPKAKKVTVFIDDLNMPSPEQYGAQPPLELIRQFLELGGFYDTKALAWKDVQDVSLIAACAPPGGGRNDINPRLLKYFCMIVLPHPSVQALQHIFQVQLGSFLQSHNFLAEIQKCRDLLSSCSIAIYYRMGQSLLPTPAKCHYTFNLRDLFKVLQGLLQANESVIFTKENAAQLLSHEASRVFHDRLVEDKDRQIFYQCLSDELHNYFKMSWPKEKLMKDPIQFADFLEPSTSAKSSVYRPVTNHKLLVSRLDEYRIKMKISSADTSDMCVFFKEAIQHIIRATRVLRQPGGHMMLVGLDGTGKVTNVAMACYISECELFRLSITQNYSQADFREELKKVYKRAGLLGKNMVLLITETDLVKDSFLEDINCILNSGEIPDLFDKEELDGIFVELKLAALEAGVADNPQSLLAFFLQRARCKIHVVLALSPTGQTFRERCRLNPSLVNCCTIDWYDEWPEEALLDVATGHITQPDLVQGGTDLQNDIAKLCVEIHKSASRKVAQFTRETGRHYYITPQNYLGFIETFSHILRAKKEHIMTERNRFFTGLSKLLEASSSIEIMQEELVALGPQIEQKSKEVEVLMSKLQKDSVVVEQVRAIVKQEEEAMAEETKIVEKYAENAFKELSDVLPALQQAVAALDSLDKSDISEVRVYTHPPFLVLAVMNAVCVLLQKKPDWSTAKLLLGDPGFLKRLVTLDKDSIPDKVFVKLRQYSQTPEFNPKVVGSVSNACRSLCQWVLALEHYHQVRKTVEPKERRLVEAKEALRLAQGRLKQKQKALSAVEEHQQSLQKQYSESVAEKEFLAHRKKLAAERLKMAAVLIAALDEEKVRWKDSIDQLDLRLEGILGNILVSTAFVVYCGVFTSVYRAQLLEEWLKLCKTYKIPVSDDYSIVRAMASKNEVRRWQNDGLPPDTYSTENAILVKNGQLWPLLIDPHGQAYKWICQMEGERLQKVQVSDPGYIKVMENAIRLGEPILLLDVAEELDPSLKPLLGKKIYRRAGQDFIKMGDSEIEYNHNFRLYMTTTMPNPHFLPGVCIMVTMINFTVTFQGLQDQLLSMVVEHKQPHLEEQRSQLMESITADLYMLHELEEKSLTLLQKTEGHLLDDRDLIETLKKSKVTSRDVFQRIEASEKTEATIQEARKVYLPIATRGAVLYFVVADLIHLNYMYQFSLHWFHQVFMESLRAVEVAQPQRYSFGVIRPSSRERSTNKTSQSEHEDTQSQIHGIINALTENVYKIVSSGLFTEHQLCFSFMLSTNIMKHTDRSGPSRRLLPNTEWDFFLHSTLLANSMDKKTGLEETDNRGNLDRVTVADGSEQSEDVGEGSQKPCAPEWLAKSSWKQCQYMSANMEAFSSLCGSLSSNTWQWKDFSEADDPYQYLNTPYRPQQGDITSEDMPSTTLVIFQWEKLSSFQKLIMIKVLRPQCLISSIRAFIVENVGPEYLQSRRMSLKQVSERCTASTPLIFILSPGTDPVGQLERLALETRGGSAHVDMISLGRGQGTKAEELISKAQHLKGRWVFLQNCHLAASFMPKLQEIVDKFSHQDSYTDPQFRLWLSSKPDAAFPISILQKGFKMAVEPPQGLKGKLLQTFDSSGSGTVTEKVFEKEDGGHSWKKLVFSLCFFNAAVNERKKYGSLGWNIPYQFTSSDLEVSIQMLGMFMRGQAEIPWQAVHYLTGEVVYGGRVTDSWDRRCLLSVLDNFFNPAVLQENHAFTSDKVYRSLSDSATLQDYRDYLSSLPDTDSPEIFGMHLNAERAHLESQAQLFLDTIVSMQSRKSVEHAADSCGRGEQNKDQIVLEITSDILHVLPPTVESKTKEDVPVNADGTNVTLGSLFSAPVWDKLVKSTKGYDPLINSALLTVLRQEIDRFDHLLSVMHTSLRSLKQSIAGEIILNKGLEEVYNSLLNLKVPRLWQQSSYESCKLLGPWVDDLVQRVDFFSTWANRVIKRIQERFGQILGFQKAFRCHRSGTSQSSEIPQINTSLLHEQPSSYWLSAFFFPQGFLTAVLQNHARMKGLSVDSLTFKHRVHPAPDYFPEANRRQNVIRTAFRESPPPQEGILIFGLFLDGAKWDIEDQVLEESEALHRFYLMPQIHFIPHVSGVALQHESSDGEVCRTYECPLYRTPRRAGTLSSTGLSTNYVTVVSLSTHTDPKLWIRRGAALLCQTDD